MKADGQMKTTRTTLLLIGSFTFAFLLGEMVHDSGHYICHLVYGNHQVQVHFDPFGGTHISGADNLSVRVLGVTSAAGPLANLIFGLLSFILLWRVRRPVLLPFLLWGPVAMIQEGVTFSLGTLTPGGDAALISAAGLPKSAILPFGITLLVGGMVFVTTLLPLAGLQRSKPWWKLYPILLLGMCALMLVRWIHSLVAAPQYSLENTIPLVFSCLLSLPVAALFRPVTTRMGDDAATESNPVTRSALLFGLALGVSMFVFQIVAFK
jgi:hypothetical protein